MQTIHSVPLSTIAVPKASQQKNLFSVGIERFSITPFHHASSSGSGISLQAQKVSPVFLAASTSRTNAFTQIRIPSVIQDRLAAGPQSVQRAFQYAVNLWQTILSSPVPITLQVTWRRDDPSILGSSSPTYWWRNFPGAPVNNTWYPVALANKFARRDLNPNIPDAVINLNTRPVNPWYVGTDGKVPPGRFDLVTVALHEIYHGLTFSGFMDYSPQTRQGSWGFGTGFPGIYDRFTVNGNNVSLINTARLPNPSQALGIMLRGDRLFFNGVNAKLANFGQRSKLYAPAVWEPGSSYIHLDERTYPPGNLNSLMTPGLSLAEAIHSPGPITLGILRDMKWLS
jgi:hypothetical protein